MSGRPAVFFDRDGVINVPPPPEQRYITHPSGFVLMPGIAESFRILNEAGWPVVVVTNQKCVATGRLTEEGLAAIHLRMRELLAEQGARVDDLRYCPHSGDPPCACRKPAPGMIFAASQALGLDPCRSWLVGDQLRDLQAGRAAGCRTVWVGPEAHPHPQADRVLSDTSLLPTWVRNLLAGTP